MLDQWVAAQVVVAWELSTGCRNWILNDLDGLIASWFGRSFVTICASYSWLVVRDMCYHMFMFAVRPYIWDNDYNDPSMSMTTGFQKGSGTTPPHRSYKSRWAAFPSANPDVQIQQAAMLACLKNHPDTVMYFCFIPLWPILAINHAFNPVQPMLFEAAHISATCAAYPIWNGHPFMPADPRNKRKDEGSSDWW